jgi:4-carboxymuconolactone decarboxylase
VTVYRDERDPEHPKFSRRVINKWRLTGVDRVLPLHEQYYALDPDWTELFHQFVAEGMYSREVVSQATREICACAVLACLDKQVQLASHLINAIRVGASKEQILEAVLQSVMYAGFAAAQESVKTYMKTFPDMTEKDRPPVPASEGPHPSGPYYAPAMENLTKRYGEVYAKATLDRLNRLDPAFSLTVQRYHFAGLYGRSVLTPQLRQLVAVGASTVTLAWGQLELDIAAGLRFGCKREELLEIIFQTAVYNGLPHCLEALEVFERVAG